MKKGIFRLLTAIALCAALALSMGTAALADVIFEPDSDFYAQHRDECEYLSRIYIANSASGAVSLFASPEDATELASVKNGDTVYVSFSYKDADGAEWGCTDIPRSNDERVTGWLRMELMAVKYDCQAFIDEFGSTFGEYSGDGSVLVGKKVRFWTYPESGEISVTNDNIDSDIELSSTYTDESGRQWAYVSYYRGIRDVWVCLDDIMNPDIAKVERQTLPAPADDPGAPSDDGGGVPPWLIIIIVVAIAVSATVIVITSRKHENAPEDKSE